MKKKLLAIALLAVSGGLILSNTNKDFTVVNAKTSDVLVSKGNVGTLEEERAKCQFAT